MQMSPKALALVTLVVPIVLLVSSQAQASVTAEELLKRCEGAPSESYCAGYVAGFYDGRTTSDYGKPELMSCPPTDPTDENKLSISNHQMVLVFIKWAKDHPELLHYDDWQALRQAFAAAWPCVRKR